MPFSCVPTLLQYYFINQSRVSVFVKNIAATVLQRNLFCKSMNVIISPGIVSGDVTSNSFFEYLSRMNLVTDSFQSLLSQRINTPRQFDYNWFALCLVFSRYPISNHLNNDISKEKKFVYSKWFIVTSRVFLRMPNFSRSPSVVRTVSTKFCKYALTLLYNFTSFAGQNIENKIRCNV